MLCKLSGHSGSLLFKTTNPQRKRAASGIIGQLAVSREKCLQNTLQASPGTHMFVQLRMANSKSLPWMQGSERDSPQISTSLWGEGSFKRLQHRKGCSGILGQASSHLRCTQGIFSLSCCFLVAELTPDYQGCYRSVSGFKCLESVRKGHL